MFPYGMIAAANLLNRKTTREATPPKIETLKHFTDLSNEDFYNLLVKRSEKAGILEMLDMISNWQNFDTLNVKQKHRFVTETVDPSYYSLHNRIKRFLNR